MFDRLTPVVKNLIIANIAVFLIGHYLIPGLGLNEKLALFYFDSPFFQPFQLVSHMFVHGSGRHLLFNMLWLFFLAPILESYWGPKKFITFYLASGIGAALIYTGINFFQIGGMESTMNDFIASQSPSDFYRFISQYDNYNFSGANRLYEKFYDYPDNPQLISQATNYVESIFAARVNIPMVGASGAIYGVLMAVALLFPNMEMMLLFIPFPIKMKYFALGYAAYDLISGISNNPGDNVAHFAHLGGMVSAYILITFWRKTARGDQY